MPPQLISLTTSSPSSMNLCWSIAATRTTRWSLPPAVSEPVVQEAVQPWVLRFARRETVPEAVRCLLSRKLMRLQHAFDRMRQNPRVNSNGALLDAMFGSIRAAVTIRCAEKKVKATKRRVGGSTTSQVHHVDDLFSRWELTIFFQERLAHSPEACPMAIGVVKCKRFQSMAPPSWTMMHSHTRVGVDIFGQDKFYYGFPQIT